MTLFSPDNEDVALNDAPQRRTGWSARRVGTTLVTLSVLGAIALTAVPIPFALEHPGPWWNTLGTNDEFATCSSTPTATSDEPLITIEGATTYPTSGALDLLTVCLNGNPDAPPNWFGVMSAYLSPAESVIPFEYIYPPEQTQQQRDEENSTAMVDSQNEAIAAALIHLGYDLPTSVTVYRVSDDMPAAGVIEPGDTIVAADGEPVTTIESLRSILQTKSPEVPVDITLVRDGDEMTESVTLVDQDGSNVLGIIGYTSYTYPFDVTINLNDVGGPSAGMMFALGIIDKLTPGNLTGGENIAGTGTITAEGAVGPIGGIRQKMYSAIAAGASYFLAPAEDCPEVVGHVPSGLRVFSVTTLDDALAVLDAVAAGDKQAQDALPTCS